MLTLRRSILLALCACAVLAPGASAVTLAEVDVPTAAAQPRGIILGPDGNLWFAEEGTDKIARIVPGNPPTITDFPLPQNPNTFTDPKWLTVGPDNKIWFTADVNNAGGVGKLDPANPAAPVSFGGFGIQSGQSQGIATGFDNNLWVLDSGGNGRVVRIDPATGLSISKDATFAAFSGGRGINRGPDGNMWAAAFGSSKIAKIPPSGDAPVPVEAPTATGAWDIIAGPDGNVYFTEPDGGIGKVSPATPTSQTVFKPSDPPKDLFGIAVGGDGALWSPRAFGPDIARMTLAGQFTFVTGLQPNGATPPRPEYIAAGPDNTLWFTDKDANKIGRISDIITPGGGGGGGGGSQVDKTSPGVTGTGLSDTTVVVGPGATAIVADKTGTTIRYTLTEAAKVTLRFERKLAGRRVKRGKKTVCAKPTRKNRKKRKCSRYKSAGTLTRSSVKGKNSVKFTGRIGRKALKRGGYRLSITATDAAGNKSKPRRLSFRVVKPPKRKRR